jgi:hypothetical protein
LTLAFVSSYKYLPGKIEKEEEKCAVVKQKTYKKSSSMGWKVAGIIFPRAVFLV